jgi:hypothetical protein
MRRAKAFLPEQQKRHEQSVNSDERKRASQRGHKVNGIGVYMVD